MIKYIVFILWQSYYPVHFCKPKRTLALQYTGPLVDEEHLNVVRQEFKLDKLTLQLMQVGLMWLVVPLTLARLSARLIDLNAHWISDIQRQSTRSNRESGFKVVMGPASLVIKSEPAFRLTFGLVRDQARENRTKSTTHSLE
jgi:hypothetical protein